MTVAADKKNRRLIMSGLAGAVIGLAGVTSASAAEVATMGAGADITPMCGTKPMTVALTDGYGGDTWRKIVLAEVQDELSKCSNIKRFIHTNANGDQQKSNSDINSLVSQLISMPKEVRA